MKEIFVCSYLSTSSNSINSLIHAVLSSDGSELGVGYWMFYRLGRLSELLKASKKYVRDRPPLKWTFRALYWSPLYMAFVHYGYTIKYVSGKSMQVRDTGSSPLFLFL